MTYEFRGADLSQQSSWPDFAEALGFFGEHQQDGLQDMDRGVLGELAVEHPDAAIKLLGFLSAHQSPVVRAAAVRMADEIAGVAPYKAARALVSGMNDAQVRPHIMPYMRDVLERGETELLAQLPLDALALVVRSYRQARESMRQQSAVSARPEVPRSPESAM